MCFDRLVRNFGFGLGALAALGLLFYSVDYEPYVSALAR